MRWQKYLFASFILMRKISHGWEGGVNKSHPNLYLQRLKWGTPRGSEVIISVLWLTDGDVSGQIVDMKDRKWLEELWRSNVLGLGKKKIPWKDKLKRKGSAYEILGNIGLTQKPGNKTNFVLWRSWINYIVEMLNWRDQRRLSWLWDIRNIRIVTKLKYQGTSRIFYNRFFGVEEDSGVLQKGQLISIYR